MDQKTYHGEIDPQELADVLVSHFDQGDLTVGKTGQPDRVVVQISTRAHRRRDDPHTSLAVTIAKAEDGVTVTVGEQQVLGIAADLVQTGIGALLNPLSLLGEIDDIARDVSKLNLPDQVWEVVEEYCRSVGAGLGLAPEKVLVACPFCGAGNPIGVGKCPHCGGSLADVQPVTCPKCGQILEHDIKFCTRCGARIAQ
jgi:ribosomal protein L40E